MKEEISATLIIVIITALVTMQITHSLHWAQAKEFWTIYGGTIIPLAGIIVVALVAYVVIKK